MAMKATHAAIARGLASHATDHLTKTASLKKEAARRWLEDHDLIKLCQLFKKKQRTRK